MKKFNQEIFCYLRETCLSFEVETDYNEGEHFFAEELAKCVKGKKLTPRQLKKKISLIEKSHVLNENPDFIKGYRDMLLDTRFYINLYKKKRHYSYNK